MLHIVIFWENIPFDNHDIIQSVLTSYYRLTFYYYVIIFNLINLILIYWRANLTAPEANYKSSTST
jgi:hypothetical protein